MEKIKLGRLEITPEALVMALDLMGDHISIVDRDFTVMWGNKVAKAHFGEQLIGMKCYAAYHGRENPCPTCLVAKTFEDGQIHRHEIQVTPFDGAPLYFSCSSSVMHRDRDGMITAVIEISKDVTALKQREYELRRIVKMTSDREERMADLKEEIRVLKQKISGTLVTASRE